MLSGSTVRLLNKIHRIFTDSPSLFQVWKEKSTEAPDHVESFYDGKHISALRIFDMRGQQCPGTNVNMTDRLKL